MNELVWLIWILGQDPPEPLQQVLTPILISLRCSSYHTP
jgi:hypothetical protein